MTKKSTNVIDVPVEEVKEEQQQVSIHPVLGDAIQSQAPLHPNKNQDFVFDESQSRLFPFGITSYLTMVNSGTQRIMDISTQEKLDISMTYGAVLDAINVLSYYGGFLKIQYDNQVAMNKETDGTIEGGDLPLGEEEVAEESKKH